MKTYIVFFNFGSSMICRADGIKIDDGAIYFCVKSVHACVVKLRLLDKVEEMPLLSDPVVIWERKGV